MRILVVSNLYPPAVRGGYELACASVVDALRRRHEVTVLTSREVPPAPGLRPVLGLLPPNWRGTVRAPGESIRAARAMRMALAQVRPDLVYVWNGAQIPQAALREAERSSVPVAYSIGERWFAGLYTRDQFLRYVWGNGAGTHAPWALAARALNRLPGLRFAPAPATPVAVSWHSDALPGIAPPPAAVRVVLERVIPPGTVREPELRALTRAPEAGAPLVAFVGRVEPEKGADIAVDAVAALRERHGVGARLVYAGRAEPGFAALLQERARAAHVDIELRGQQDIAGVVRLLAAAHVLLVPSVVEEGFGLVPLEGAFAHVPIVAARIGALPGVLRDEQEALYFPPRDAIGAADALARTLRERAETTARVERAAARAETFSLDRMHAAHAEFVQEAVSALREWRG